MVGHELGVRSALLDLAVGDSINVVDLGEEVQSVGNENLGSTFGVIHEHLLEHCLSDMGIQSGKGILKAVCQSLTGNEPRRYSHQKSERRHHSRQPDKY